MGHAGPLSLLPRASSPLSFFFRGPARAHSSLSFLSLPRGPRLGPAPPQPAPLFSLSFLGRSVPLAQPRALPFLPRSLSLAVADRGTPPVGVVPFPAPEPDSSSSPSSTDPAMPSSSRARTPGRRRALLALNPSHLCSPLPCVSGRRHAVSSPPSAVA
jgi:hypothetical protein